MTVTRYEFPNGTEWISVHDTAELQFHIFWYARMGQEKERKNEIEGMHLLEHLFFRGKSPEDTAQRCRRMEKHGIDRDGNTHRSYCNGYLYGPVWLPDRHDHYKQIIEDAHFCITNENYHPHEFQIERQIVRQELMERRDENRWIMMDEFMDKRMYNASRYGRSYDDAVKSLDRLTQRQVFELRERLFRPQNLTIITIGKVDDGKLDRIIQKTFGAIPAARPIEQYIWTPPPRQTFLEFDEKDIQTCFVQHTLRTAPPNKEDLPLLHILDHALTGHRTSILFQELRQKRGQVYTPASSIGAGRPEMRLDIMYTCDEKFLQSTMHRKGNLEIVQEQFERLATTPIPEEDFQLYRRFAIEHNEGQFDDPEKLGEWYGQNAAAGMFIKHTEFPQLLKDVTAKQVRDKMHEWLPGNGTVILRPKGVTTRDPAT
jgi:predicted Zn-dependent peptidase